jgi:anaerobic selenocysteine-containing dehydrogenase
MTGNLAARQFDGSINSRLPCRVGDACRCQKSRTTRAAHPALADVLHGRSGGYPSDVHAIYNLGGNPINQGSDVHKNMAAFAKVDFAVTHELFMTPTARWCDVIFPAASPLEKEDIGTPWLGNYLLYKPQAPPRWARSD